MTDRENGKITNPGWPDPNDWVNRLNMQLTARQAMYEAEPDVLLKRNKAGAMLGAVIAALMEFPVFRDNSVHLPLKDLMVFIADLERGRDHPWSKTVNVGGTNISTTSKEELKSWVRAVYILLRDNNFKPVEAYKHIAEGLTKSGRTGRHKLEPVRWRLVQAWCREKGTVRDELIRQRLENWWPEFLRQTAGLQFIDGSNLEIEDRSKALSGKLEHFRASLNR